MCRLEPDWKSLGKVKTRKFTTYHHHSRSTYTCVSFYSLFSWVFCRLMLSNPFFECWYWSSLKVSLMCVSSQVWLKACDTVALCCRCDLGTLNSRCLKLNSNYPNMCVFYLGNGIAVSCESPLAWHLGNWFQCSMNASSVSSIHISSLQSPLATALLNNLMGPHVGYCHGQSWRLSYCTQ
jgi:hypothetical protein